MIGGLAKPSKFAVYITAPPFSTGVAASYDEYSPSDLTVALNDNMNMADARVLSMLCCDTALPGKQLQLVDYRPQGYGKVLHMPNDITFEPLTMTFMLDNDHRVMNFMQYWMQEIVNTDSDFEGPSATFKNRAAFEINYKKLYATTMIIQFYGSNDESSFIEYEFHDVFPTQIDSVSLSWEMNDTFAKLPVAFTYSSYTTFRGSLGGIGTYATRGVDFLQSSGLFGGSLFSALTDTSYGVRNLIDSFTNVTNY